MEDVRRILVFIFCGISVVSALSGKGYYCRDPDTGFLHPANSTWQSTTFCGNYSCKLRKKNLGQTTPLRAIKVSYNGTIEGKRTSDEKVVNKDSPDKTPDRDSGILNVDNPELAVLKSLLPLGLTDLSKLNDVHDRLKHHPFNTGSGDRLLTDKEIKTISELLHNVKKSDLEAIVDIYNLAQDIYKEMDKMTSENIVEEAMRNVNQFKYSGTAVGANGRRTFWYEPTYHKGVVKSDMDYQGSSIVATSTTVPKDAGSANSYFNGPLTKTDFGKLPYYYPMSSFQRQSSYVHPAYNQAPPPAVKPPCAQSNVQPAVPQPTMAPPMPQPAIPPYYPPPAYYPNPGPPQTYGGVLKKPFLVETQKPMPPAGLLPYPFSYVQHYPLSIYYDSMPFQERFDINNNNNQKSYHKAHLSQIPSNAVPATAEKKESDVNTETEKKPEFGNLIDTLLDNAKSLTKRPDWKTNPIPHDVLEEVRAHFEEKGKLLKPFSLRKKVKLERVGKVVKLDDLHREKRSLGNTVDVKLEEDNETEYEVYIEKTTCISDNDPGFFRMGNLSEPYPACCPQRINNDRR